RASPLSQPAANAGLYTHLPGQLPGWRRGGVGEGRPEFHGISDRHTAGEVPANVGGWGAGHQAPPRQQRYDLRGLGPCRTRHVTRARRRTISGALVTSGPRTARAVIRRRFHARRRTVIGPPPTRTAQAVIRPRLHARRRTV